MTVIHKKCNAKVESSGDGDWGYCTKCGKRVDHLHLLFEDPFYCDDEVEIIFD